MKEKQCPVAIDWSDPVTLRIAADWYEEDGDADLATMYRVWASETELMQRLNIESGTIIRFKSGGKVVQGEVTSVGNRYWFVARTDRPADGRRHIVFAHQLVE